MGVYLLGLGFWFRAQHCSSLDFTRAPSTSNGIQNASELKTLKNRKATCVCQSLPGSEVHRTAPYIIAGATEDILRVLTGRWYLRPTKSEGTVL